MNAKFDLSKSLFGGRRHLGAGRLLLSYHKENQVSRAHHFSISTYLVHQLAEERVKLRISSIPLPSTPSISVHHDTTGAMVQPSMKLVLSELRLWCFYLLMIGLLR